MACVVACTAPAARPVQPVKAPSTVVQLDFEPSFMISAQFYGVPPFTLLDDGTLIDGHSTQMVTTTKLPREEVARVRARVLELGFERLHSRRSCPEDRLCPHDLSYTILRVALPSGELREVRTYHNASNEPETQERIAEYLMKYAHPSGVPYRPTRAVLHVSPRTEAPPPSCPAVEADLVRVRDPHRKSWAFLLEGPALARLLAVAPVNRGRFAACAGGVHYGLTLIPELPNVDLSKDLGFYLR